MAARTTVENGSIDSNEGYWDADAGPRISSAGDVEGRDVRNNDDEKLGEIAHVMLDYQSGRIAYALMSAGGFLGIGDKLIPVPWTALTYEPDAEAFLLDMTKEELEHAESFDRDDLPSMAEQAWAEDLHDYFGARPYWR